MHNPHVGAVKALLAAGAKINAQDANGWSALMVAALHNPNPEVVAALLEAGADTHAQNGKGHDALWFAQRSKREKIADVSRRRAVNEKIVQLLQGESLKGKTVNKSTIMVMDTSSGKDKAKGLEDSAFLELCRKESPDAQFERRSGSGFAGCGRGGQRAGTEWLERTDGGGAA